MIIKALPLVSFCMKLDTDRPDGPRVMAKLGKKN